MAWTQTEIDALKAAMARGVRRVRMNGEEVEFASLTDMRQMLARMEAEVAGVSAGKITFAYPTTSRGL